MPSVLRYDVVHLASDNYDDSYDVILATKNTKEEAETFITSLRERFKDAEDSWNVFFNIVPRAEVVADPEDYALAYETELTAYLWWDNEESKVDPSVDEGLIQNRVLPRDLEIIQKMSTGDGWVLRIWGGTTDRLITDLGDITVDDLDQDEITDGYATMHRSTLYARTAKQVSEIRASIPGRLLALADGIFPAN